MMPVSGPIPECSTRESLAASSISVSALYAEVMAEPERAEEEVAFEKLVASALRVDPKGLSGKHKNNPKRNESKTRAKREAP